MVARVLRVGNDGPDEGANESETRRLLREHDDCPGGAIRGRQDIHVDVVPHRVLWVETARDGERDVGGLMEHGAIKVGMNDNRPRLVEVGDEIPRVDFTAHDRDVRQEVLASVITNSSDKDIIG